jgi:hypothetical protein
MAGHRAGQIVEVNGGDRWAVTRTLLSGPGVGFRCLLAAVEQRQGRDARSGPRIDTGPGSVSPLGLGFFAYPPEKVYSRHDPVVIDGGEGVSPR